MLKSRSVPVIASPSIWKEKNRRPKIHNVLGHRFDILRETLHLEYQPTFNRKDEMVGAETLLRCVDPDRGEVSPENIIQLCKKEGITKQLNAWIIQQAIHDLKQWHDLGYDRLSVSINLDPLDLSDDVLMDYMKHCLDQSGLDPKVVELELTENTSMAQCRSIGKQLNKLKELGVRIAIDDFGKGYSSLLYLCDLSIDTVKLDMALIHSIGKCEKRKLIVGTMISMCKELNIRVIAEGVETIQQIDVLKSLGCDYYQGHYYSKSITSQAFIQYANQLKSHNEMDIPD